MGLNWFRQDDPDRGLASKGPGAGLHLSCRSVSRSVSLEHND